MQNLFSKALSLLLHKIFSYFVEKKSECGKETFEQVYSRDKCEILFSYHS